jgi:predicted dehydrogenase
MENKKVRVALIGYGYWGVNLLRNMLVHPGIEVVGMVERNVDLRAKCAAVYPHVPAFDLLLTCLNVAKPDAVIIATPPESHCALALRALRGGAHVLIEKPMALNVSECDQILVEAEKMKRTVMIDHTFLYHAPVSFLAKEIHAGKYGDLLYFDSVRVNLGGFQWTNVVWDLAPHDIAIIDWLTNGRLPTVVSAVGQKHFDAPIETLCYVNLMYEDNFIAHLHLNWAAPVKGRQITIGGTKKMVVYDDNTPVEKVRIYDKGVQLEKLTESDLRVNYRIGDMVAPVIQQKEALAEMLNEFVNCIREKRKPLSDGLQGRRVVQVLEAVSESLQKKGQPIAVTDSGAKGKKAA